MVAVSPFTPGRIHALTEHVRAFTRQQIIDLTLEGTERIQSNLGVHLGQILPFERWVDGSPSKPLEKVEYYTLTRFETLGSVVAAALRLLYDRSPVGPGKYGHYRDDHWLYLNRTRVDSPIDELIPMAAGDVAIIVNMRPYARKLEGGPRERRRRMTNRRPGLSVQAPNGVYEISAYELRRRFGNIATIKFIYTAPIGAQSPLGRDRNDRYPAIEISAKV